MPLPQHASSMNYYAESYLEDNETHEPVPSTYPAFYAYCPPPTYHNFVSEEPLYVSPAGYISDGAYTPEVPLHAPILSRPVQTPAEPESPLDVYSSAPQIMFPTPCELLTDLAARDHTATAAAAAAVAAALVQASAETQRKAYFRAVAESIGFQPTDPDTITSHDKKRSYLECLERYVQWLHEQIQLAGHEPIQFERVSTYDGLTSRSMRVRRRTYRKFATQIDICSSNQYVYLQNQLAMRQMAVDSAQGYQQASGSSYPYLAERVLPPFCEGR
ncbi:hypothetical protein B0H21DRAFT_723455, partial [Amylocystis lapponica]